MYIRDCMAVLIENDDREKVEINLGSLLRLIETDKVAVREARVFLAPYWLETVASFFLKLGCFLFSYFSFTWPSVTLSTVWYLDKNILGVEFSCFAVLFAIAKHASTDMAVWG